MDRQIVMFYELGAAAQEIVIDKDKGHSEYQILRSTLLQSEDILIVPSLNHLSDENEGIVAELQYFKDHKIRLKILDMPTTLVDLSKGQEWAFGMFLSILIEGISSMENQKKLIKKEKQLQGIEALKHTSAWENYGRPSFKIPENLSLIHISEPTRQAEISYAVFCLKKKNKKQQKTKNSCCI